MEWHNTKAKSAQLNYYELANLQPLSEQNISRSQSGLELASVIIQ